MKTFIFLFIVIFGLFVYIFFYASQPARTGTSNRHITHTQHTNIHSSSELPDSHATDLSAEAGKKTSLPSKTDFVPDAIPEDMAYEELKSLIVTINPRYPSALITLNSHMRSLLPTQQMQSEFIQQIRSRYHLTLEESGTPQHHFRKHRLLWDWVNMIR